MNERDHTEKVITELLKHFPNGVALKHSDRATSGIPDLSFTVLGSTFWFENKYLRKGEKLKRIVNPLQLIDCHLLAQQSRGKCWIIVFQDSLKETQIWQPLAMWRYVKGVAEAEGWPGPTLLETGSIVLETLNATGALKADGWIYELPARLVHGAARS